MVIPACFGVLLDFFLLQDIQEVTILYEWKNDDFVCSDVMFASQDWDSGR